MKGACFNICIFGYFPKKFLRKQDIHELRDPILFPGSVGFLPALNILKYSVGCIIMHKRTDINDPSFRGLLDEVEKEIG